MGDELLNKLGYVATEDGRFVSGDHMRIAEIIRDYDPDLCLAWIPPEQRRNQDTHPWAVFYRNKLVATFEHCDHRILAHLWSHDSQRGNVLAKLDAENAAAKAVQLKEELEMSEARQDIIVSALRTPLHNWKLTKDKVIRG
jgi:hypothetical protein